MYVCMCVTFADLNPPGVSHLWKFIEDSRLPCISVEDEISSFQDHISVVTESCPSPGRQGALATFVESKHHEFLSSPADI